MKNLSKSIQWIVIFFGLFSLFGCNFTEPAKPSDTLLLGQLSLDAKGFQDYTYIFGPRSVPMNGIKKANLTIVFRNKESQKTYAATTDNQGGFYLFNPQSGSYVIDKLIFKNEADLGWESITVSGINLPLTQPLEAGKVCNLGLLRWNAWVDATKVQSGFLPTLKNGNSGLATLNQDGSFDKLKAIFAEKLPKSRWLQKEWLNIEIAPPAEPANVNFDYQRTKDQN